MNTTIITTETSTDTNSVQVRRERLLSRKEEEQHPQATSLVEVVSITFGDGEPKVDINRDFCE